MKLLHTRANQTVNKNLFEVPVSSYNTWLHKWFVYATMNPSRWTHCSTFKIVFVFETWLLMLPMYNTATLSLNLIEVPCFFIRFLLAFTAWQNVETAQFTGDDLYNCMRWDLAPKGKQCSAGRMARQTNHEGSISWDHCLAVETRWCLHQAEQMGHWEALFEWK